MRAETQMSICRLLPTAVSPGATNMAGDEALLRTALDRRTASLRFYTWAVPTLSLGYFQGHADRLADPLLAGVAWVRRPTGGAAILHHHELTYALALPASHPAAQTPSELYRRVHEGIAAALGDLDLGPVRPRGQVEGIPAAGRRPLLCFQDRDPEDLVLSGSKIVGSAQRRRRSAVLQHGSILVSRSARVPELPGASDLAGRPVDPAALAGPVLGRLAETLHLELEPDAWRPAEADRIAELESRNRDVFWIKKR